MMRRLMIDLEVGDAKADECGECPCRAWDYGAAAAGTTKIHEQCTCPWVEWPETKECNTRSRQCLAAEAPARTVAVEGELAAAVAERDRLRAIFDAAGQGEHNVLALVDHYQRGAIAADEWVRWAADLLDDLGRQPPKGRHDDAAAREILAQLAGMAPGAPRCARCGCFATRHEVEVEELRACADCECTQFEVPRHSITRCRLTTIGVNTP